MRARRREMARKEERRAKGEGERERRKRPGREKAAPRAGCAQAPRGSGNRESEAQAGERGARRPPRPGTLSREQPGASAWLGTGNRAGQGSGSAPAAERSLASSSRGSGRWCLLVLTPQSARDAFLRTRREGRGAGTRFSASRTRNSAPATVTCPDGPGKLRIVRR